MTPISFPELLMLKRALGHLRTDKGVRNLLAELVNSLEFNPERRSEAQTADMLVRRDFDGQLMLYLKVGPARDVIRES